jgi:hypothetical protein
MSRTGWLTLALCLSFCCERARAQTTAASIPPAAPVAEESTPSAAPPSTTDAAPSVPALPDTPAVVEARSRIHRAEALFEAENYDAALAEFEKSYELLQGHPLQAELLYNIALCHERRFRYTTAMQMYARYMQEAGSTGDARAAVEATVRTLSNLLASVEIASNVRAEVWIDDNLVGIAPGSVLVPGGRHTLELRAAGHESQKRELRVAAREVQALSFELAAIDEGLKPVWFYSTLGATVATAIVGIGYAAKLKSERGSFADKGPEKALNRRADREHLDDLALRADVFFATSAVLALTSTVLALFTDFGPADAPAPTKPSARLRLSPTAIGFEGSF